ncbi:MAG: hypothetical protein BWY91_03344 [bacterium ADurb.BinA028]|nr:MAG: hypothetical protein BWY91_03344 [bacterium ADurb.BinA028]
MEDVVLRARREDQGRAPFEATAQRPVGQPEDRREARSGRQAQHRSLDRGVADKRAIRPVQQQLVTDRQGVVDPCRRPAALDLGDEQLDLAVGAGSVGNRIGPQGSARPLVAEHDVLPRPEAQVLPQRTQLQLDHGRRPQDLVGEDERHELPRREQLLQRVDRAELDVQARTQGLGHAHEAIAAGSILLRESHIQDHALVECSVEHLGLALAARARTAVVGHDVARLLQGREHGVAGVADDLVAGGLQADGRGHRSFLSDARRAAVSGCVG